MTKLAMRNLVNCISWDVHLFNLEFTTSNPFELYLQLQLQ
ncbi:hypothetical protein ACU8KH_00999 [Lachancea thermotolerans]